MFASKCIYIANVFTQNGTVAVKGTVSNLPQGPHGFHIHVYGDFSNGCLSAAGHYNPLGRTHGAPIDEERYKAFQTVISITSYFFVGMSVI